MKREAYVVSLHFGVTVDSVNRAAGGTPPLHLQTLEDNIGEELTCGAESKAFRAAVKRAGGGPIYFMPNPGVRVTPVEGGA